ncbi:hypothetical protein PG987_005126 [Apiospora arundinis]
MFLTQADKIECIHEPFCDAYHFGPERLSERFEDENVRAASGYSQSTYQTVLDNIEAASTQGKRTFIKDMAKSLIPPLGKPVADICPPSLRHLIRMSDASASEISNPTVLPDEILRGYHFTFLIRHPRFSIPSLYKISTPPGSDTTGWHGFHSDDAGYLELRTLFDYLKSTRQIGPVVASGAFAPNGQGTSAREGSSQASPDTSVEICVIDAEDLLKEPEKVCRAYCASAGLRFDPSMLSWQSADDQRRAQDAFQKSWAIHVDALSSKSFDPSKNFCADYTKSTEILPVAEENAIWARKFGDIGAEVIRQHVDINLPHYDYLKQYALKI